VAGLHVHLHGHLLAGDARGKALAGGDVAGAEGLAEGGDAAGERARAGVVESETGDVCGIQGNGGCEFDRGGHAGVSLRGGRRLAGSGLMTGYAVRSRWESRASAQMKAIRGGNDLPAVQ
jgi:hypothetical protein